MQRFLYVLYFLTSLIVLLSACPHDGERTISARSIVSETWAKIQNDKTFHQKQEQPFLASVTDFLVDSKPERTIEHKCVHDKLMSTVDYSAARFSEERLETIRAKQPSIFQARQSTAGPANIRFFVDSGFLGDDPEWSCSSVGQTIKSFEDEDQTITCTQEDILTGSVASTVYTAILPPVISILEQLLQVKRPVQGNFTITSDQLLYDQIGQTCYPGVPIPDNLFASNGNGVPDTDYYIFITARPVLDPTFTVAFASPCAVELITQTNGNPGVGRPVVGIANFNPRQFQNVPSSETALNSLVRVGVHEFTHALGFSPIMYDYYVDADPSNPNEIGNYYSGGPIKTTSSGGDAFITPRVVSFAKQHFGCDSITEVPLETCCGTGTTGAHWLGTIAGDEYMTGIKSETMPITQLTLSLFEDMGWYRANYVFADSMQWGYQKGCDFANGICDSTSWSGMGYLCDASQGTLTGPAKSCTFDRMGAGQCNVASDPDTSIYGDCPLTVGTKWCGNTDQTANVPIGEFFSPQSRCFQTMQVAKDYICYQVNCSENGTVLRLQLGDTWYTCPQGGGTIQGGIKVTGVRVECPDASVICQWSGINSSEIQKYRTQGGKNFTWLFTNSTILFWAIVAIVAMILLAIIWCILRCCCDICCGMAKQKPANTMTGRMQIAARNRRQYLTQRMGRGRGRGAGGARVVPEMQLQPESSQNLQA